MICKINENLNGFAQLVNAFVNIINSWNTASKYYDKMLSDLDYTLKMIDHIHKCHIHPYVLSHTGKEFPSNSGLRSGCTNVNCIDRLVRELMEAFDVDDNGLIYGTHFIFDPKDPDVPINVKEVQTQFEIRYHRLQDIFKSFDSYFEHFNVMRRCIPKNPVMKLILQMILGHNPEDPNSEFSDSFSSEDTPCSNKTYGKDFIIDPNDPEKPKELIAFEKNITIDSNIKKIRYIDYIRECIDNVGKKLIGRNNEGNLITDEMKIKDKSKPCDYVCTRLVAEWLHTTDIDGNGLIYGRDFKISDYDSMKCRCLFELEEDLEWTNPDRIVTWEQFCKTFPNNNPDDRHNL